MSGAAGRGGGYVSVSLEVSEGTVTLRACGPSPPLPGGENAVCSCLFDVLQAPRRKEKLPLRPSFPSQCFLCFYFLISKIARTRKGDFWNVQRLSAASSPRLSTGVRVAGDPEPETDSCSPERCWLEWGEIPEELLLLRCMRDRFQGSSFLLGDPIPPLPFS